MENNKDLMVEEVVEMEVDKKEEFKLQSTHLVRKAIAAIENVGKASNSKKFEYTEEEVEVMFAALEEAIQNLINAKK